VRCIENNHHHHHNNNIDHCSFLLPVEMASLQVKAVSGSSKKKSVFHRRAGTQTHLVNTGEESKPQPPAPTSDHMLSDNKSSQFVFTPSKEEFKFNFV